MRKKEKIPAADFSSQDLPHTRWKLFKDVLFHQFGTLVQTSLLNALFALPLITDYLVFSFLIGAAELNKATSQELFALYFYGCLIGFICLVILVIGLTGGMEIAKKLSYEEGVITTASFFLSLKENWKEGLVMGILFGLIYTLGEIGSVYLLIFASSQPILAGIGIGALIFLVILITIVLHLYLLQTVIYQNKIRYALKNSFIMSFLSFLFSFLLFLFFPGIFIALMAINNITAYIGMGLFLLFSEIGLLAWAVYGNRVLDKYINTEHYPELVDKGLTKKEG
ncbi:MAG: hypothetical protein LKJ88_05910 [Bacilli bacterium]|jgi:uncharacterized membrane protein YesL|nr:hypothetical protein [Bacilli bacterium]